MAIEHTDEPGRSRVLRSFVAEILALPTGPDLVAGLERLARRGDLSAREAAEVTAGWNRMIGYCQAGRLAAVVDLDQAINPDLQDPTVRLEGGRSCPVRRTADELAPLLRIAPRAASMMVGLARRVETRLPAGFDALAEGRLDYTQLGIVDHVVRDLPPTSAAVVEAAGVRAGPTHTAQQLRDYLQAEAHRVDPEHAAKAAARGVQDRDVVLRPSPLDGCQRLVADLPRDTAAAAWNALNTAAQAARKNRTRPDGTVEDRTCAQLRADLLTSLLTGQTHQQHPRRDARGDGDGDADGDNRWCWVPTRQDLARLAEVQVVVAADTLLGESDLPAHIPGIGPLDAATVQDLASRTRWRRLIVDPDTGTLIHADPTTRPPTADHGDGNHGAPHNPPPDRPHNTDHDHDDGDDDDGPGPPRPSGGGGGGSGGGGSGGGGSGDAGSRGRGSVVQDTGTFQPAGGEYRPVGSNRGSGRLGRGPEGPTCPAAPSWTHDPRWAGVLTDPVKTVVLDHGTSRYVPPAPLRLHVHTRDATCVGPACHHPAKGTQLDHTINYRQVDQHGRLGTTSHDNLESLCERSHNSKTHGGWTLAQPTPGAFIWTSPTGLTYVQTARPLVPGWGHRACTLGRVEQVTQERGAGTGRAKRR